jgi:tetratricopeptide (TPR) repeat protein
VKNGISAVLIVKNEEAVLDRCLTSLAGCDEIVVLDTGSTDQTMEIAKRHTSSVLLTPLIEPFHFAEARNRADRLVTQDWILTIDADEILDEGSIWAIRRSVRTRAQALGFRLDFKFADENGEDKAVLRKQKIYRRGAFTWGHRVHEQLFPLREGKLHDITDASITHLPNAKKEERRRQNLELLKMSVEEDPGYLRNWRQLGMENFIMGEYAEAIPHLERYLKGRDIDPLDRSETHVHIARCLTHLEGRLAEALEEFDFAHQEAPARREPLMYKALALINVARLDEAVVELNKCLEIPVSGKPEFHLNVEAIWNGSLPKEALEFCQTQIGEAKKQWYAKQG